MCTSHVRIYIGLSLHVGTAVRNPWRGRKSQEARQGKAKRIQPPVASPYLTPISSVLPAQAAMCLSTSTYPL